MIRCVLAAAVATLAAIGEAQASADELFSSHAVTRVQSDMPVIPPPPQRQQPPQTPNAPAPRGVSIDDLARQGFDIKAIDRAGQNDARYVVMMQRGGEVRTCLMRIEVQRGQPPKRESACF